MQHRRRVASPFIIQYELESRKPAAVAKSNLNLIDGTERWLIKETCGAADFNESGDLLCCRILKKRLQLLPEVINSRAFSFSLVNKDKMKQKERKHFYLSALKQLQRLRVELV